MAAFDEDATFTCVGFGIPVPTLTWTPMNSNISLLLPKFEEKFYNMTNEQGYVVAILELKIHSTTSNDEGLYKCEGSNNIPNLIEANTNAIGKLRVEGNLLRI